MRNISLKSEYIEFSFAIANRNIICFHVESALGCFLLRSLLRPPFDQMSDYGCNLGAIIEMNMQNNHKMCPKYAFLSAMNPISGIIRLVSTMGME